MPANATIAVIGLGATAAAENPATAISIPVRTMRPDPKVVGTDPFERREQSVQHMVAAAKMPAPIDRDQVRRRRDHADRFGLAARVTTGGAMAETTEQTAGRIVDPDITLPGGEARREAAWLALSTGIDAVPADDREQFLARVALLLGDRVDPADFREAVSFAASVR